MSPKTVPWNNLTVFLYTWVQVQNKTKIKTTASCKQSELNGFCERTQISLRENAKVLRERKTFEKYFFPPTPNFSTTMSLKGLRTYNIKSVTFDQFHVSLLNKSIPFFQKERNLTHTKYLKVSYSHLKRNCPPSVKSNRSVLLTTGLCRQDFG